MPITLLWAALPSSPMPDPIGAGCPFGIALWEPHGTFCPVAIGQVKDGVSDMATPAAEPPTLPRRRQLQPLGCPPSPPAAPAWPWPHHFGDQVQGGRGTRRVVSSIC